MGGFKVSLAILMADDDEDDRMLVDDALRESGVRNEIYFVPSISSNCARPFSTSQYVESPYHRTQAMGQLKKIAVERQHLTELDEIRTRTSVPPMREEEALFHVPTGWVWTRLDSLVLNADSGWSPRCETFPRSGTHWGVIKVSAVSWDCFRPEENKQLLDGLSTREDAQIKKGDFLISRANTSELVAEERCGA